MEAFVSRRSVSSSGRSGPAALFALPALCAALGLQLATPSSAAAQDQRCSTPSKDSICGVTNVEDLVMIDGTHWAIGSSLPGGRSKAEVLYLFDTKAFSANPIYSQGITVKPDTVTYANCPGAPDFSKFASHGLDFRGSRGRGTLYVVNHGGRESVEVFTVDTAADAAPKLTWTGCVIAPSTAWPDGVAALPDGGFVATSLWDPSDKNFLKKLSAGKPAGGLFEWHPKIGWQAIGPADVSGPNGLVASSDGRYVYVALWGEKKILKYDRDTKASQTVAIDLAVDNLRWTQDRRYILAGGQDAPVKEIIACFESKAVNCLVPYKVFAIEPSNLTMTELVYSGLYDSMGAGTGALQVGGDLWLTTFRSDRIVRRQGVFAR